ncbi:hypothetical protein QE152_g7242 [Popillia japonica]|uniref:Uncharacterized protein n=1 Tax=Popillia japonica TaxID=7064 RepID=A0AAW1MC51_POPJA
MKSHIAIEDVSVDNFLIIRKQLVTWIIKETRPKIPEEAILKDDNFLIIRKQLVTWIIKETRPKIPEEAILKDIEVEARTTQGLIGQENNPWTPRIHPDVKEKLKKKREYGRKYYDQGTKQFKELEEGNNVRGKHASPRSYIIENEEGNLIRWNRVDSKSCRNLPSIKAGIYSEPSDDSGNESKINYVSSILTTNDNTTNTDQDAGLANIINPDITVSEKTYTHGRKEFGKELANWTRKQVTSTDGGDSCVDLHQMRRDEGNELVIENS